MNVKDDSVQLWSLLPIMRFTVHQSFCQAYNVMYIVRLVLM